MKVTCMFEKSIELLENLFYYYGDNIKDLYSNHFQEDFYWLVENCEGLLIGAEIYIDDKITIVFHTDKEEYSEIKEHFEKMLEAFGCYSMDIKE